MSHWKKWDEGDDNINGDENCHYEYEVTITCHGTTNVTVEGDNEEDAIQNLPDYLDWAEVADAMVVNVVKVKKVGIFYDE